MELAYERPNPEVTALFDRASDLSLASVLITSPGPTLPDYRAGITLRVARGSRDGIGLHAATLAAIEGLLVGCAGRKRDAVRASLDALNEARAKLSNRAMDL